MAQSIVTKALSESKTDGLYSQEPVVASALVQRIKLQRIKNDPTASADYRNKVKGGMTDDDFLEWYAIPEVKRRILEELTKTIQFAHFVEARSRGLDAESAMAEVRRFHPYYGDPSDESQAKGKDRPLPIEVLPRANRLLKQLASEEGQQKLLKSSSFNAYFRSRKTP